MMGLMEGWMGMLVPPMGDDEIVTLKTLTVKTIKVNYQLLIIYSVGVAWQLRVYSTTSATRSTTVATCSGELGALA